MRRQLAFAFFLGVIAQTGGNPAKPSAPTKTQGEPAKAPEVTIAGNFGQWALVCGKEKDK